MASPHRGRITLGRTWRVLAGPISRANPGCSDPFRSSLVCKRQLIDTLAVVHGYDWADSGDGYVDRKAVAGWLFKQHCHHREAYEHRITAVEPTCASNNSSGSREHNACFYDSKTEAARIASHAVTGRTFHDVLVLANQMRQAAMHESARRLDKSGLRDLACLLPRLAKLKIRH